MMRHPRFIDADGRGKAILKMITYMDLEGWGEACGGGGGGGVRLSTGQLKTKSFKSWKYLRSNLDKLIGKRETLLGSPKIWKGQNRAGERAQLVLLTQLHTAAEFNSEHMI